MVDSVHGSRLKACLPLKAKTDDENAMLKGDAVAFSCVQKEAPKGKSGLLSSTGSAHFPNM